MVKLSSILMFVFVLFFTTTAHADNLLYAQETTFRYRGTYGSRAQNIRAAARSIDGRVLAPREEFSFNEVVGPRTHRRGFRQAPVIVRGRIEQELGGGVCQVAGTLHAAALHAGLTVIEEHPHSRVSSYLSPGLDTTVVYGRRDFRFINNLTHAVRIRMFERAPGVLRAEIWSTAPPPVVHIEFRVWTQRPFRTRRIQACWRLPPGRRDIVEAGTPYIRGQRRRVVDGRGELVTMTYPSSDRIIHYCPRE